ncbi:cell division protein DivIVA [Mycobacterium sp. 852002-51971_SCH5477799-a]|uniref:DivIVA domain-containing protein n=1 Tax=Mycobacterium sp. 852002-51971_SCH5477799-a TaxID=1834106 RepID=UPI0007FFC332|nr:DivIVA domain-containing protein [Mycobacterium sp. 852002-51971_SCH5477799-a]OBF67631.1 cell division protein DivIVA [Mycobacterium sp. 852002-51971_SCH5477799-a]
MSTGPAKTFSRTFRGYDTAAVDAYIEVLLAKQQFLIEEVQNLRAQRNEAGDEAAALRIEVACLTDEVALLSDTSPSPYAMQHRMAKLLRRALDEISQMQSESRAEVEALIAQAEAETEVAQREHRELLADIAAQRKALETECAATRREFDAELARMRAEAQSSIDQAWQEAQQEREQLIADAKQRARHSDEQARATLTEANQQRIMILEELMGVARDLQRVPDILESAYQERNNPPEESVVVQLDPKTQTPGPAVAS